MEYYVANIYGIGGNMDESHTSIVEQKKPETQLYILCNSIYIQFKNR